MVMNEKIFRDLLKSYETLVLEYMRVTAENEQLRTQVANLKPKTPPNYYTSPAYRPNLTTSADQLTTTDLKSWSSNDTTVIRGGTLSTDQLTAHSIETYGTPVEGSKIGARTISAEELYRGMANAKKLKVQTDATKQSFNGIDEYYTNLQYELLPDGTRKYKSISE